MSSETTCSVQVTICCLKEYVNQIIDYQINTLNYCAVATTSFTCLIHGVMSGWVKNCNCYTTIV